MKSATRKSATRKLAALPKRDNNVQSRVTEAEFDTYLGQAAKDGKTSMGEWVRTVLNEYCEAKK